MEEIKLDVKIRQEVGTRKIKDIRRNGGTPAVVYGGDRGPVPIELNFREYRKIMKLHRGENVVFHLAVHEGEKKLRDYSAILQNEQFHPVTDNLVHVDFKRISLDEIVKVNVPFQAKGEAIGVKKDGGNLDYTLRTIEIECVANAIPKNIEVDVSDLNIGDAIHVKDINFPEGVVTKHDLESVVFTVLPPMRSEESSDVDADAEPEVIGKKEKDGEGKEDSKDS